MIVQTDTKSHLLAAAALALALAGCGGEPQPQPQPDAQGADQPEPAAEPAPAASATPAAPGTPDPDADTPAGEKPTDPAIARGEIPARFHGMWDAVQGDCNPASDMRMIISAREITFYESIGKVTAVGQEGTAALADLSMAGEGQTWFQSLRLSLSADGKTLETGDATKPKVKDKFPRKRCPA